MFSSLGNCWALSQEAAPFYIPTSSAWGVQYTHILANTLSSLLIMVILLNVTWYLIVILKLPDD